jgi:gamma-glutamylcyclotransferase (GGCT)/AIG2-like uncharacterized protein YtfP
MHRIFVYGTLLPGLCRHYAMQGSRSLGRGTITGLLYDLGPYPAVVHGAGKVWGEVFEVDATVLAALDAIEAFYSDAPADKSEYIREEASVCLVETNTSISAWFYRFNRSIAGKRLIEHGDYLKFLDETGFVPQ